VYDEEVPSGAYAMALPEGMRFPNRISFRDAEGAAVPGWEVEQVSLADFHQRYGTEYSLVPPGQPAHWTRAQMVLEESQSELLRAPGFLHEVEGYTAIEAADEAPDEAPWCLSEVFEGLGVWGVLSGAVGNNVLIAQYIPGGVVSGVVGLRVSYDGGITADCYRLRIHAAVLDTEAGTYAIVDSTDWEFFGEDGGVLLIQDTLTHTAPWDLLIIEADNALEEVFWETLHTRINDANASLRKTQEIQHDILFLPPAREALHALVEGGNWCDEAINDLDITWWSGEHPDLLILAVKRQIAIDLNRNQTEVNEYAAVIEEGLFDLVANEAVAEQDSVGFGLGSCRPSVPCGVTVNVYQTAQSQSDSVFRWVDGEGWVALLPGGARAVIGLDGVFRSEGYALNV